MNSTYLAVTRPLHRRALLKAAGVTLALPWLEAMVPTFAHARNIATPEQPRRFVGMMTNMGILPEFFFPTTPGKDYESTPYMDILKEHRQDFTVFSGVALPGVNGGHASEKSFLTGAPGAASGTFRNSISLDQMMAEKVGAETRLGSLSIMIGSDNLSLSWTRSGSMIPPVISPVKLYQQLFVEDTPQAKAAAVQRLKDNRSLMDSLSEKARKLESQVGAADRDRLDQYYTSLRELEKRLATAQGWIDKPKPKVTAPKPEEITDRNNLPKNDQEMFDLVRLALETDSTRIVTVAMSLAGVTPTVIPGVKTNTHQLSHHGHRPEKMAELRLIEEAQFRDLATFLKGLRHTQEQGSNLLERTSVLYGTNMGSANAHSTDNLPVLLAGGGFKHGQHLAFDRKSNYPLSNLHVTLLQRMGVEADRFSSGTATMRGLEMV